MWFLAIKQIFSRKSQTFLTFLAIVIGASGYIVFTAIQLGFKEFMISRLIERDGHIRITPKDNLIDEDSISGIFFKGTEVRWINKPNGRRSNKNLTSANEWYSKLSADQSVINYCPFANTTALVTKGSFSQNISIMGIDPEKFIQSTNFNEDVTAGNLYTLNNGIGLAFAGEKFINLMGININDTITVIAPDGTTYPMKIIGTFNTGDHRSDERVLYTSMKTAQNILRSPGFVSRIVVKIKDVSKAQEIATLWQATSMDDVESWDQANQNFLSMTDTQDMVRTITTMTFILVVSFGIYNILNMVVSHKKREIAILRSIGFDEKDTIFLFLIQGALISIVGAGLGLIIGFGISLYIESVKIPMGRGFMRVSFDASIYLKSFLLVFGSSIIASFFPARAAGKLSPIEIIKGTS